MSKPLPYSTQLNSYAGVPLAQAEVDFFNRQIKIDEFPHPISFDWRLEDYLRAFVDDDNTLLLERGAMLNLLLLNELFLAGR